MPTDGDPYAGLGPLFAAERERRLASMEEALRLISAGPAPAQKRAALGQLAQDAHALKGAAQIDARHLLSDLVTAFESRLMVFEDAAAGPQDTSALLEALAEIRAISGGNGR